MWTLAQWSLWGTCSNGLDVLIEGAAQKGIEHLNAPADAEDGLVGGEEGAEQLRLGGIPQGVGLAAGGDAGLPVEGGLDVAAAGQQQAVAFQRLGRGLVRVGQLHPADLGACAGKALDVFGLCSGELRVGAHPGHGNDNRHLNDLILNELPQSRIRSTAPSRREPFAAPEKPPSLREVASR